MAQPKKTDKQPWWKKAIIGLKKVAEVAMPFIIDWYAKKQAAKQQKDQNN